jgi:hypothetical protein
MAIAFYMLFEQRDEPDTIDRIGGSPTYLPGIYPTCRGEKLGFVAQFECHTERLPIPGAKMLQIYSPLRKFVPVDELAVVLIPDGATVSDQQWVRIPELVPHNIYWEERDDPEPPLLDRHLGNHCELMYSKIGGTTWFPEAISVGETCLIQLEEIPGDINFGGRTCLIIRKPDGECKSKGSGLVEAECLI